MQFYSFDANDPIIDIDGWKLSFQIITLENTYGLDPEEMTLDTSANSWKLACRKLSWAGQQQKAPGRFHLEASKNGEGQLELRLDAESKHKIRCVKVLVKGLDDVRVFHLDKQEESDVPEEGEIFNYPYRTRKTPVFFVKDRRTVLAFRSEDHKVRAKRFAVYRELTGPHGGTHTVELIHEESASAFDKKISVPPWILGKDQDPECFHNEYLAFAESDRGLGLVPWQKRTDMPEWAKGIALSLTLHGMHWSGYIFNTYRDMLEIIYYVADRIEGNRVLAYLPGWEGRYYWQYGEYRPEPRLGGEEGFRRLCREARELGVHVMPMFGGNCANEWLPNFHEYGPEAHMKSATRDRFHGNTPDWDISRAHDTGWQAWLNPGSPSWRRELTRQVTNLVDEYGFDAVFYDTLHCWTNDPDFDVFDGTKALKEATIDGRPDLLVVAENWYDGLLSVFPFFQDEPFGEQPGWLGLYARVLAHLLEAEPSRGSTGVHEWGHRPYEPRLLEEAFIPTIAFVDGTFEESKDELDDVVDRARQYRERFLSRRAQPSPGT